MSAIVQEPKPDQFDGDGVELIERPKQFVKLLRLLDDRGAVTVGTPGDTRRIRITLLETTGG